MERSRPNWQNYLVAIVLTAALLAGGFYGKFLFSTMEAGLFIGCCAVGALPSGRRPPHYGKECVRMLYFAVLLAYILRVTDYTNPDGWYWLTGWGTLVLLLAAPLLRWLTVEHERGRGITVRLLPPEKALAISRRQAAVLAGWYLLLAAAAGGIRLSRKEARCAG